MHHQHSPSGQRTIMRFTNSRALPKRLATESCIEHVIRSAVVSVQLPWPHNIGHALLATPCGQTRRSGPPRSGTGPGSMVRHRAQAPRSGTGHRLHGQAPGPGSTVRHRAQAPRSCTGPRLHGQAPGPGTQAPRHQAQAPRLGTVVRREMISRGDSQLETISTNQCFLACAVFFDHCCL